MWKIVKVNGKVSNNAWFNSVFRNIWRNDRINITKEMLIKNSSWNGNSK